jgi:hypothetical protein
VAGLQEVANDQRDSLQMETRLTPDIIRQWMTAARGWRSALTVSTAAAMGARRSSEVY